MKKTLFLLLLFANSLHSRAPVISQDLTTPADYPKGYFRNPLGIPMQLVANFGELRPNHFHMGFDIRTNQRENLPVYAAADGYVSKIKIEKSGFGHALYITHPNGYTTLYAHLNEYYPALQSYIKERQYADQKWEQEITFDPEQFPVLKGQFVAYSGNTGASEGPHLHFEIRDTKTGNNLNPWLFDFGLQDKIPPSIYRLYYYDRRYSTYKTNPVAINIKGINGTYSSSEQVVVISSPYISFGITAEDKTSISSSRYGIYEASLSVDDSEYTNIRLNDISYNDTRYANGSIDYKTRISGGAFIQHLSRLPGNNSNIFLTAGDGTVAIEDTAVHNATIKVNDANGNSSLLSFRFRLDRTRITDKIFPSVNAIMIPGKENVFKTPDLEAIFSYRAFYDTVPFLYKAQVSNEPRVVSEVCYLHNYIVPVHDSFTVKIRPVVMLSDSLKERVVVELKNIRKSEVEKGRWTGDFMSAKFRDFGAVKLILDTIPPRINLLGWASGGFVKNRKSISLVASDNVGDIKNCQAFLDGQWILLSRKNETFTHTFDERTAAGTHELKVIAEDIAGNTTERNFKFTR